MKTFISYIKPIIAVFTSCIIIGKSTAQDAHLTTPDPGQMAFVNFDPSKDVFNLSGARINIDPSDIAGDPFLLSNWVKGNVSFFNGQYLKEADLKFNLVNNELQFLSDGKALVFAQPVKSFTLVDTAGGVTKRAWFLSGYPEFGMHKTNAFYQVLAIGPKVHLIKFISKHTTEMYQYNVNAKLSYKTVEDLHLYDVKNEKIQFINPTANSVEKGLSDFSSNIHELVKAKGSKKLSENDIIDLVNKVNSQ